MAVHQLGFPFAQLPVEFLLHLVDGRVKVVFPGLRKKVRTRHRQMDFDPELPIGMGALVVPEDHVGSDDPTLKMVEMGQLVFNVGVDPVSQREMPGSDMNVHG